MNRQRAQSMKSGRTLAIVGLLAADTLVWVKYTFTRNGCHWFSVSPQGGQNIGYTVDCPEYLLADLK